MRNFIQYVSQHPLLLTLLVGVAVGIIFSIFKKLLKAAIVLLVIFIAASALFYHFADKEWAKKGKEILESTTKKAEEVVNSEGKKLLEKGLHSLKDSAKTEADTLPKPTRKKK